MCKGLTTEILVQLPVLWGGWAEASHLVEVDWSISALTEKYSNIQGFLFFFFCCCFLIEVQLIYNMVLVLSTQQSDTR